jgi:hypothetical protein
VANESNTQKASEDISNCISMTLLAMKEKLAEQYDLTPGELLMAITGAQMQLLAGAVAASIDGVATEETHKATIERMLSRFRAAIAAELESRN